MKINHLSITGFLSYQEKVDIDFTPFELACITGENGAGKSSILDAITWALFGKCRQSNESLINLQSDEAVVIFDFDYSGESYMIQRSNKRGKPARLVLKTPELDLTERTTRDTQSKIESILKIDYETFIHAVFFLQGESDQFVSANSSQRKQVLFDILGLDAWETFRLNAAGKIKEIERGMEQSRGVMGEIEETLLSEPDAHAGLVLSQAQLDISKKAADQAQKELSAQEEKNKKYETWQQVVDGLEVNLATAYEKQNRLDSRIEEANSRMKEYDGIIARKEQIQSNYDRVVSLGVSIQNAEKVQTEWNKLNNALTTFVNSRERLDEMVAGIPEIEKNIAGWEKAIEVSEKTKAEIAAITERQVAKSNESTATYSKKCDLEDQILQLEGHKVCPLCEQELADPDKLIIELRSQKLKYETKYRELVNENDRDEKIKNTLGTPASIGGLQERINTAREAIDNIRAEEAESHNWPVKETMAEIAALGYDPAILVEWKEEMEELTTANVEYGRLETAEKAIEDVKKQMADLRADLESVNNEVDINTKKLEAEKNAYNIQDVQESRLHLATLQVALDNAQQQVMETTKTIGSLEQKLAYLQEQKDKLKSIKEKEKDNTALHQKYSTLQEAFSKKGVPALLVEQALPQIESKANELLHRLSDGQMAVHFVTQKAYADSSREDLQETLDIEIQDQAGIRDYEMYSGGESFRINFAIRMALSHVLANRAGAKLRTLVIDEGFGSQDAGGRDRLINAINIVKAEYDKVLVITHIPEVIEAFPVQLRVEKGSGGSKVRIL